jgi:hypothetical protein
MVERLFRLHQFHRLRFLALLRGLLHVELGKESLPELHFERVNMPLLASVVAADLILLHFLKWLRCERTFGCKLLGLVTNTPTSLVVEAAMKKTKRRLMNRALRPLSAKKFEQVDLMNRLQSQRS